jgi:hypothetical protein
MLSIIADFNNELAWKKLCCCFPEKRMKKLQMTKLLLVLAVAIGWLGNTTMTLAQENSDSRRFTNHLAEDHSDPESNGFSPIPTDSRPADAASFPNRAVSYGSDENAGLPLDWQNTGVGKPVTRSGFSTPNSPAFGSPMTNVAYSPSPGAVQDPQSYSAEYGQTVTQDGYRISPCTVQFIDDIELPALESGQITELSFREGDLVPAGSTVGQIDDQLYRRMKEQAQLRLEIAIQNAEDETSISAAYNEIEIAGIELKRMTNLASKGSRASSDKEKAEFDFKLAMLKKTAAENQQKNALGESRVERSKLNEAEDRIRRHEITSTSEFDTNVIEIFRDPLEWVNAGEPVMRLGRMDRLWVNGVIDTDDFNAHEVINQPVTVTLQLARGEEAQFKGKIVHVGLERQHSDKLMVKAEIENRPIGGHWVLQPNSSVVMTIHVPTDPSTTAVADQFPIQNR